MRKHLVRLMSTTQALKPLAKVWESKLNGRTLAWQSRGSLLSQPPLNSWDFNEHLTQFHAKLMVLTIPSWEKSRTENSGVRLRENRGSCKPETGGAYIMHSTLSLRIKILTISRRNLCGSAQLLSWRVDVERSVVNVETELEGGTDIYRNMRRGERSPLNTGGFCFVLSCLVFFFLRGMYFKGRT